MVLKDMMIYLKNNSSIATAMNNKIYSSQAPFNVEMPFMIVEITAGTREDITFNKTESLTWFRITVDVGPTQETDGYDMIWTAHRALENYRGDLGDTKDVYITCSEPRGWAGIGGAYRYQFDAKVKFIQDKNVVH